jgi:tRNA pseudouridine38-40 synthase
MNKSSSDTAGDAMLTGRIALCVSYNGNAYFGWQSQQNDLPCVQDKLESALSRIANHSVKVVCAGRTDKSVHATYQIVHFDTHSQRSERSWVFGCNANLPNDISVSWARIVGDDFHARFSAFYRRYNYFIYNHPIRSAHFFNEQAWCHFPLDASKMHEASQVLLGKHDFSSFRAVGCQSKSPVRTIEHISVKRYGHILLLDVQGNAFLHHMVRNIAGVLMTIGSGREPLSWCAEVLAKKDRREAGVTASPNGLYLVDVGYPEQFCLPGSAGAPSYAQSMLSAASEENRELNKSIWDIALQSST